MGNSSGWDGMIDSSSSMAVLLGRGDLVMRGGGKILGAEITYLSIDSVTVLLLPALSEKIISSHLISPFISSFISSLSRVQSPESSDLPNPTTTSLSPSPFPFPLSLFPLSPFSLLALIQLNVNDKLNNSLPRSRSKCEKCGKCEKCEKVC